MERVYGFGCARTDASATCNNTLLEVETCLCCIAISFSPCSIIVTLFNACEHTIVIYMLAFVLLPAA